MELAPFRFIISIAILLTMILWEFLRPRRSLISSRSYRWSINLGLAALNFIILKLTGWDLARIAADLATESNWGLLNFLEVPYYSHIILSIVLLDFLIYWQHVLFHKVAFFWRLHSVHHSDTDFDTTTAVRFHPLEIILSMVIKVVFILLIGANPFGVLIFEIILNGCALFNHANINLAPQVDRLLRFLVVTPDMHRIHHSTLQIETDSNYGFSISLWDHIFKSHTSEPKTDHPLMRIGLSETPNPLRWNIFKILLMPFRKFES
jgi:sterol desaturase/sphingolipid hydroxylase (fatty acid hydroxylase superfamily)